MRTATLVAASAVVLTAACSSDGGTNSPNETANLPTCGTSTALFTTSPVSLSDLLGWVPLGNLNPPGHLFPTDHQYLYVNSPENASTVRQVNVVSPGNITITRAHRTNYSTTNTNDYAIEFSPCAEVFAEFGHVTTIVASLLDQMGAFDQNCNSYTIGTTVFSNCFTKQLAIEVAAGAPIGTVGGQGTSFALDWTLKDGRAPPLVFANPARWPSNPGGYDMFHTVAASDYFAEPARTAVRARLGAFNGNVLRTAEPRGGAIAYDVAGTAQGIWINASKPTYPEESHLAFVPDNVDPSRFAISMGRSQPGFAPGLYAFTPASAGMVNRHPVQVTPDGNIYCYEFPGSQGVVLIRLEAATSLKVEGRTGPATCALQQPFAFTTNAFVYVR